MDDRRMVERFRWWMVIVPVAAVIVLLGGLLMLQRANNNYKSDSNKLPQLPLSVKEKVVFPIYYPENLPEGMVIDEQSFSATDQVVTYAIDYDNTKKILVSIQARSAAINPDDYDGDDAFTTKVGKAVMVRMDDRSTAALFGEESWALINAPGTIDDGRMRSFVNSLQSVQ